MFNLHIFHVCLLLSQVSKTLDSYLSLVLCWSTVFGFLAPENVLIIWLSHFLTWLKVPDEGVVSTKLNIYVVSYLLFENSCFLFVVLVNAILISIIENILLFKFINDKTMNNTFKGCLRKRLIVDMMCFCIQIRYMTFSIPAWLSHQDTYIGYMGRRVITKQIWKRSYCYPFITSICLHLIHVLIWVVWYGVISLTNQIDMTLSAEPTRLIWRYQPNQPDWYDFINLTNQTDMMLSSGWNHNTISALICINDPFTFCFSVHAIVSYSCKICN